MFGLYWNNGKQDGNYYLGFRGYITALLGVKAFAWSPGEVSGVWDFEGVVKCCNSQALIAHGLEAIHGPRILVEGVRDFQAEHR